jgi:uncharacterized lipoprotein YddW (UPF0748 family)
MRALPPVVGLAAVLSALSGVCAQPEQRAVWANYRQVSTPEGVRDTVEKVSAAHLNAIYLLVWYNGGQAAYQSELGPMMRGVAEGHDPLGALIEAAHARGIHVHAWFVNGSYGYANPGHLFTRHPEWQLQTGATGSTKWYDLGKPQVRQFERDVMLECLRNYDLDGIHFDYIRFSGRGMCTCDHCQAEVQRRFGIPPVSAGNPTFPIALEMSGNPLDKPTTAQVLAAFEDGVPAITLNGLGEGEAVLLNWQAVRSGGHPVTAFAAEMLARFGVDAETTVYQLRTAATMARYGLSGQDAGVRWLQGLGCKVRAVGDEDLDKVPAGATVALFGQYLIAPETAGWLESFVTAGGHVLCVDGPVFAIKEPALQRVLGLSGTANYFSALRVISPAPDQELIAAGPPLDLEVEKRRSAAWEQFRRDSVTELVRMVYRDAKALKPEAQVSAAVFQDRKSADAVCQDWYGWLGEGIIDYVLPMAYTDDTEQLKGQFDEWQAFDPQMQRIIPGLSIYSSVGAETHTRDIDLILQQHGLCAQYGTHGTCFFSLEYLSPELQQTLAEGPYKEPAEPYYPAGR